MESQVPLLSGLLCSKCIKKSLRGYTVSAVVILPVMCKRDVSLCVRRLILKCLIQKIIRLYAYIHVGILVFCTCIVILGRYIYLISYDPVFDKILRI